MTDREQVRNWVGAITVIILVGVFFLSLTAICNAYGDRGAKRHNDEMTLCLQRAQNDTALIACRKAVYGGNGSNH